MKNTIQHLLGLALFSFLLISCGNPSRDAKEQADKTNEATFQKTSMADDSKFVTDAADAGMLEVKLGELTNGNALTPEVKDLGKMMVTEHTKANEELKALAQRKNISVPSGLSNKSQKTYDDLKGKTGKDFDEEYSKLMVKDHKKVLDAFKKEADKGSDPDIKSWAAGKVSTLEHHLMVSEQAEKAVDDKY